MSFIKHSLYPLDQQQFNGPSRHLFLGAAWVVDLANTAFYPGDQLPFDGAHRRLFFRWGIGRWRQASTACYAADHQLLNGAHTPSTIFRCRSRMVMDNHSADQQLFSGGSLPTIFRFCSWIMNGKHYLFSADHQPLDGAPNCVYF